MASVSELEADIAATRERLNSTIGRLQDKLTVSGMVDEFMGQAGVPRMETGHDFVLGLLRRHPVPVMVAAAGIGFLFYSMNRRDRARAIAARPFDDDLPVVVSDPVRPYDPDRPSRRPLTDIADTRHIEA